MAIVLRQESEFWAQHTAEEQGKQLVQHLHIYDLPAIMLHLEWSGLEATPQSPQGLVGRGQKGGELQKGKGQGT
jgi:hypothetical protein